MAKGKRHYTAQHSGEEGDGNKSFAHWISPVREMFRYLGGYTARCASNMTRMGPSVYKLLSRHVMAQAARCAQPMLQNDPA
jgi:hypothetical protein